MGILDIIVVIIIVLSAIALYIIIGTRVSLAFIGLETDPMYDAKGDIIYSLDLFGKRYEAGDSSYIVKAKEIYNKRMRILTTAFWPFFLVILMFYGVWHLICNVCSGIKYIINVFFSD